MTIISQNDRSNNPSPVDKILARLSGVKKNGKGWMAICPAHADQEASLSVDEADDGKALLKCFGHCTTEEVLRAIGMELKELFPYERAPRVKLRPAGLTLAEIAEAKRLSEEVLRGCGCTDDKWSGVKAVRIPYLDEAGKEIAIRYRTALHKSNGEDNRFRWRKGDSVHLYGLNRLENIRRTGWVMFLEGESDCWTFWQHGLPALGVPGKSNWKSEWAALLDGLQVFAWQEPGAEDFIKSILRDVPDLRVIVAPEGVKDISEAHIKGIAVPSFIEEMKLQAVSAEEMFRRIKEEEAARLTGKCARILASNDPLELVKDGIRRLGYGGDLKAVLITYLSASSRLLGMRPGAMPVHLLILGPASAGKSYTVNTVLRLLPESAYVVVDAGSPRVLIYDTSDVKHKLIIFGEADSLPAGEDNPAASAIRNLLQEHNLVYKVTVKAEGGGYTVKDINREGPSTLITTSTKRLGHQLDTRLFTVEVADDVAQVKQALAAQANLELNGVSADSSELVAFQSFLQMRAPWDVYVPFAGKLADEIGRTASATRILRDYARLLSLVKSVAILRHQHRKVVNGRLMAELEDYQTVAAIVGDMYEASIGASELVRQAVQAVATLVNEGQTDISQAKVAKHLGIGKMAASRRINTALSNGWLVNKESRKGQPMDLRTGDPLPARNGLPTIESLMDRRNGVTPHTDGDNVLSAVGGVGQNNLLNSTVNGVTVLHLPKNGDSTPVIGGNTVTPRIEGGVTPLHGFAGVISPENGTCNTVTANTDGLNEESRERGSAPAKWEEEF